VAALSKKYSDPEWSAITAQAEKKAGIPAGFLHSIVNYGERSNADQVSEAGARTPYQIIPSTAKLIKKKYGIDPYLSPENSALGAALLLKESLDRNNGDPALAAAEYHGGTDRKNWGRKTKAYVGRVMSGMQQTAQPEPNAPTIEDGTGGATVSEPSLDQIHAAYKAGKFTPEQKAEYEADIASGVITPPADEIVATTTEETVTEAVELPENIAEAYATGKMDTKQMRELEADVASGLIKMPRGYGTKETGLGVIGGATEMVTGAERSTPESDAAPEIAGRVFEVLEGSDLSTVEKYRVAFDIAITPNPEEAAKILKEKTGGAVTSSTDEKGNLFIKNTNTGKDFILNKPGLSATDAFQTAEIGGVAALALTPAGRVAQAGGGGLLPTAAAVGGLSAAAQTGIEAEQASQGGSFDGADIALAGAIPAAVPVGAAAARPAINAIAPKVMQGVNAVKTMGSRGAQAIPEPSPVGAGAVLQQADEVAPPVAAPVEAPVVAPRATPEPIPAAPVAAAAEEGESIANTAFRDWYNQNRTSLSDELFIGGQHDVRSYASLPESLQTRAAHGMSKSLGSALTDLRGLLKNGIDPNRGGGKLYTAPLGRPAQNAGGGTTAGGNAYSDGAFTLIAKKGVNDGIADIGQVEAIVVNSSLPDGVVAGLRREFPNIKIGRASEVNKMLSQNTPKTPLAAPRATPEEVAAIHTPDAAPSAGAPIAESDFAKMANKAASGDQQSMKDLAAVASVNPEAKAAADALGLQLPADLISDSPMLKEAGGMARSVRGKEHADWKELAGDVNKKVDDALAEMGASPETSSLSERVKSNLDTLQKDLKSTASKIYDEVETNVPPRTVVAAPELSTTLKSLIADSGSQADKGLLSLAKRAGDKKLTYTALKNLKSEIGSELSDATKKDIYGNTDKRQLAQLYDAVVKDQMNAVETTVGGEAGAALKQNLQQANALTAKRKVLEKQIVAAFGKDGEGTLTSKILAAVKSGGKKDDVSVLKRLLNVVPEEYHKETVLTSLMSAARTPQGNFSPNEFANIYRGIRENAPVAKEVFGRLSKEQNETLRHIYTISRRMRDAENAIDKSGRRTGQLLYDEIIAQNAIGKILDTGAGKLAVGATSKVIPPTFVNGVVEAVTVSPTKRLDAINKLLGSSEFSDLLESASKQGASDTTDRTVKRFMASKAFSDFAKAVNMPRELTAREQYVITMLQGGKGGIQETDNKGKF